jgi:type VI secretion system protein ImpC
MSQVAASAHAPFLAGASQELFNLDSFRDLSAPRDLWKIFDSTEYAKWRAFRQTEDARYVALVLPHMLMRLPYGAEGARVADFNFEEEVDGTDHSRYLWANAAYGLAARLTSAFATFGWSAAIRGVEGGGVVSGLPVHTFRTDDGDVAVKCPTEIPITDRREKELSDLGFIPLVHCKGTDFACFFSAQSCQKPSAYLNESANAAARASAQLPFVLAGSRFAHYLKAMMRDKIGSFMSRSQCEQFLNRWVSQYVTSDEDAPLGTRARYPLKSARIDVVEVPGKPGAYSAVAFLVPNFQLEQLPAPLRITTLLPQGLRY